MSRVDDKDKQALGRRLKRMPVLWLTGIFIVVVCLSIISIDLWQLNEAKQHDLIAANKTAVNLSRALAQQADDAFDQADIVLSGLIERLGHDGNGPSQKARLHALLQQNVTRIEQLQGLFVYDRNGEWLASSFENIPANANNSDREYFKFHKNNESLAPHISAPIRSRTTGDWIIPFSRRINDAEGHFDGVVLATLELAYFDRFFARFDIDPKGTLFLALTDGTILTRRPRIDGLPGTSIAKGDIFTIYLPKQREGTAMLKSIVDNVKRLYGYKQLDNYPLVVAASISEQSILEQWSETAWKSVVVILCVVIANVLLGTLLFQQIRFGLKAEAKLRIARNSLEKLALQDSLTGLANRRHFQEILSVEFARRLQNLKPLSLIMLDIDFFKSYNDTYGHVAGDKCITAVAQCINASLNRPGDLAVRYGGEEMAVFLPYNDVLGAQALAEKIRLAIVAKAIEHSSNPLGVVTASFGVYECLPSECPSMETFIERADVALYAAKHSGRNRTMLYSQG